MAAELSSERERSAELQQQLDSSNARLVSTERRLQQVLYWIINLLITKMYSVKTVLAWNICEVHNMKQKFIVIEGTWLSNMW